MKKAALITLLFLPLFAGAQTSNMARVIAREMLRIGVDTSKYFTSITDTIYSGSTDRQAPTAAAVYEAIAGGLTLPTGTHDGQILVWNGSAWEEYSGSAHGNGLYWDSTNGWQEYGLIASNQVFASSGTVGAFAKPAMRTLVAADIPTISLTAGVSGTLPAANGGTGNSSYTTGDILYASGTTTLSKLADVATGNALISGGVGVAPLYGKIGLTTHVSGTLPVTSGGTGLTSATQGDIVYASAANTYSLLAKNTTATRYLSNTGTSNNPAWAQIALATGVSGTLTVSNGGTGLTTLTANRIPYGNGTSAFQSSGNLTFDGTTLSVTGKASLNIGGSYSSGQNFFSVSGTVTGTSNSANYNGFYFAPVFANDGTVTNNSLAGLRFSQSSSGSTAGISYNMVTGNTNTSPNVSQLYGIFSRLDENTTSGNLSTRVVGRFQCYKNSDAFDAHSGTGLQVDLAENSSSGRWNNGSGLVMYVNNAITLRGANTTMAHSKGTGNTQYGYQMTNNVSGSGVIVNDVYGLHLSSTASSGGVITNYYGIYQNSIPAGGTLTYFLYNNNNARSYTNGSFAIGTDATTAKLLVRGSGTTSSTYSGIFEKSDGTDVLTVRDDGRVGVLVTSPQTTLDASGGTDGVVLPVGTDAQRPSVNGTIRGNSDNGGVEYRVGNQWYRLVASQTPSVAAGAAAGTGATAILFDGSNDLAGGVTLTTGTSATTGTLFTLTFADAFFTGLVIKVTLTPADSDAAAEITKYYVSSASTTTFVVTAATALTDSTEYKIYYQIGQ